VSAYGNNSWNMLGGLIRGTDAYKKANLELSNRMKGSIKNPYPAGTLKNEMFDELLEDEGYRFGMYGDTKNNFTTSVGHLVTDETAGNWVFPEDASDLLSDDIDEKYRDAINYLTPEAFNNLSWDAKKAVVNMNFRGDLRGSPVTSELLRQGRMSDAAKQYLINKEYEVAKKSGDLSGIVDRMEENARRLAIEKNPGYLNSMSISSPDASNRSHFYLKYWRPE
jgi:hypothetical protein